MSDTKNKILMTALKLFAKDGYEAVSVSSIAEELQIAKSALYKHYKNKRDIFESIVRTMEQRDAERACEYKMPQGTFCEMPDKYREATVENLITYSMSQLKFWTEDEFACRFRKMLTLEQYRNDEMSGLYQQYLSYGPYSYVSDIFLGLGYNAPEVKAAELYSPMFFLYSMYDGGADPASVMLLAKKVFQAFYKNLINEVKQVE